MGQRHQVFLIARVRPKHGDPAYRCIAAFHHQWCYGSLPLSAMHRFFRLVTRPENAAILREELREMDGKYGRARKNGSPMPMAPCPYGVSLLATAWTTDLPDITSSANSVTTMSPGSHYDGVTLRHGVLDANMGCWGGHNDDGISIIDVTNPLHPAYCFMSRSSKTWEPLSAYQYLQEYYNLQSMNDTHQILQYSIDILRLCGIPLLEAHVLKEAWPRERFERRKPEQDHVVVPYGYVPLLSDSDYLIRAASIAIQRLIDDPDDDEPRRWHASLESAGLPTSAATDLRVKTYLLRHPFVFDFQFVSTPKPWDEMELLLNLPPKIDAKFLPNEELAALKFAREDIRASLRHLSPFPEDHLDSLLELMAISGDHFADLSGYDLSAAQIIRFASRCPGMDSLDISRNPHIVLSDIPAIFNAAPHLRRLNVCGCDAIDGQALLDLVRTQSSLFLTAEAIVHPAFLTIVKPPDFPIAFTFMCACDEDINGVGLPLFTPTQVLQALCQILPPVWHSSESQFTAVGGADTPLQSLIGPDPRFWQSNVPGSLCLSSSMLTFAVFSSGSRPPGQSWSDRAVIGVPLHPYPSVSALPEGSWAFYLDSSRTETVGHTTWTFVHYGPDDDSDAEHVHAATRKFHLGSLCHNLGMLPFCIDPHLKRRGQTYDLRGFLRCMAEEGRPLPPAELVEQLECLLYSQHGGQLVCLPTQDADVPTALTVIPSVPLDRHEREDGITRRMYALESEVHPRVRYWTDLVVNSRAVA